MGIGFTFFASFLYSVSAAALRMNYTASNMEYNEALVSHAAVVADHYNDTIRRHGSIVTLSGMPPMPLNSMTNVNPFPPGYQGLMSYPNDPSYYDKHLLGPRQNPEYVEIVKELRDAKL
jgi:hypothetical protein